MWENFGESLLMKQMARKILANQLAGLQLFHTIFTVFIILAWKILVNCIPFAKFFPLQIFPTYGMYYDISHDDCINRSNNYDITINIVIRHSKLTCTLFISVLVVLA